MIGYFIVNVRESKGSKKKFAREKRDSTLRGVDGAGGKGNPSIGVATLSANVLLSLEKFFVASFSPFSL